MMSSKRKPSEKTDECDEFEESGEGMTSWRSDEGDETEEGEKSVEFEVDLPHGTLRASARRWSWRQVMFHFLLT